MSIPFQRPLMQTAVERQQQLLEQGLLPPKPSARPKKTPEEVARESLMTGMNLRRTKINLDSQEEVEGSVTLLPIESIWPYSLNPRKSANPSYEALKASIKAQGMTSILTVTRRRGESAYFLYGGGNTRLAIAKELRAQGDERFKMLHVVIKGFKGEASVLAAHMAENLNRGETTFWDNAQGVISFKREWEVEHGKTMSSSDLHQQLRSAGVDFGAKTVQNLVFAADHLAPIGPWLQARELNTTIRPVLDSYFKLADRLALLPAAQERLRVVLHAQAEDLERLAARNLEIEPAERQPVVLDMTRLMREGADAIAAGLDLPVTRMQALSAALQARPGLSGKDLMVLDTSVLSTVVNDASAAPVTGGRGHAFESSARPELGRPSSGDLASEQSPLGRSANSVTAAQRELKNLFIAINKIVRVGDFVIDTPEMPFGFFVELPEELFTYEDPALTELRQALWYFFLITSGQTQQSVYQLLRETNLFNASKPYATRWSQALAQGPQALVDAILSSVGVTNFAIDQTDQSDYATFEAFLPSKSMWRLLAHAAISPLLTRMLGCLHRIQPDLEIGYPAGQLLLPSGENNNG